MSILNKFLDKIGVKDYSELTSEEKTTYRSWEDALSGRKLTDKEIATFFETEIEEIQVKLISARISSREDLFLKMKLEFIRSAKAFLATPLIEKQMVENEISNLIQK